MLGPTAAGKSRLAMRLAEHLGGEIVSVDSMQVYRGMDIGTAKPGAAEREAVRHHCIDITDPQDDFSVAEFQTAGRAALVDIEQRGAAAVIAGGTGLHFRSLVDPLEFPPTDDAVRDVLESEDPDLLRSRLVDIDPRAGERVDLANPRRVLRALEIHELTGLTPTDRATTSAARQIRDYQPVLPFVGIGIDPGAGLDERIVRRFDAMLADGLVDEVERLRPVMGRVARQAVGYKEMLDVVAGDAGLDEGRRAAIAATTALAKRQRTFFRRDPRITWLPSELTADVAFDHACAIIGRRTEG